VRELKFLTKNKHKAAEFKKLFSHTRYEITPIDISINEIQSPDLETLVTGKLVEAFAKIRRPVFVDHTGLRIDILGGFPEGLTELFWERLKNPKLAELCGRSLNPSVVAVTVIGFCDGKKIKTFRGEVKGKIAAEPAGPEGFQWDPIFVPDGHTETFAQMGTDKKNQISMRRIAIEKFIEYLDRSQ
jgi:XTP/dITP diphosphohydrolase